LVKGFRYWDPFFYFYIAPAFSLIPFYAITLPPFTVDYLIPLNRKVSQSTSQRNTKERNQINFYSTAPVGAIN
jgi:hypothetical protein